MSRKRKRKNWTLVTLAVVLVTAGAAYILLPPMLEYLQHQDGVTPSALRHARWGLADSIRTRLFELVIYVWVFVFGSCIGSFLNVVIYRLPRRMSLLGVSKCPFCRVSIPGYDNVPVFAWIALRGRCRSCHLPISIRYPLVELIIGCLFLAVAMLEVFQGGVNLPRELRPGSFTLDWFIGHPPWDLLLVCAYHLFLLCVLFSWAWIHADRQGVPLAYSLFAILVGVAVAAWQPDVHPLAWTAGLPDHWTGFGWIVRLDDSLIGFIAGAVFGFATGCVRLPVARGSQASAEIGVTILAFILSGVFLGWQATLTAAALGLAFEFGGNGLLRATGNRWRPPGTVYIWLAVLIQIVAWRYIVQWTGWPSL